MTWRKCESEMAFVLKPPLPCSFLSLTEKVRKGEATYLRETHPPLVLLLRPPLLFIYFSSSVQLLTVGLVD